MVYIPQEVPGNDGDGEVSAKKHHTVFDYDMENIFLGGASPPEQVTHSCTSHVTVLPYCTYIKNKY